VSTIRVAIFVKNARAQEKFEKPEKARVCIFANENAGSLQPGVFVQL
jgi:hypothetical protein